jgi:hypothetical protein
MIQQFQTKLIKQMMNKKHEEGKTQTRWGKFTYVGRQTKFITKLFKKH